jgi:hypothetical protein
MAATSEKPNKEIAPEKNASAVPIPKKVASDTACKNRERSENLLRDDAKRAMTRKTRNTSRIVDNTAWLSVVVTLHGAMIVMKYSARQSSCRIGFRTIDARIRAAATLDGTVIADRPRK